MSWNHTKQTTFEVTSSALARGAYISDPVSVPVDDTTAVEIVPSAVMGQYFSLSSNGPNNVYLRFGGNASSVLYSVIIDPGFNNDSIRVAAGENVTVITATGETATLLVNIAPEVQI